MNPKVKTVEPLAGYKLRLQFANGASKVFDMNPYLDIGVFTELKNEDYFKKVRVVFGSVEWPNEQDLSYDTLYILGKEIVEGSKKSA